jgi:hypothetical protein
MTKHCIYCKIDISEDSVVDVCQRCGVGVWGPKMFQAIVDNMTDAKKSGDLYQGSVGYSPSQKSTTPKASALNSIAAEAIATQEREAESLGPEKEIEPSNYKAQKSLFL